MRQTRWTNKKSIGFIWENHERWWNNHLPSVVSYVGNSWSL